MDWDKNLEKATENDNVETVEALNAPLEVAIAAVQVILHILLGRPTLYYTIIILFKDFFPKVSN